MADDGSAQSTTEWPIPKFRFEVKWDSEVMAFQEVSGLDVESQPIEYLAGNSPDFAGQKVPGIKEYPDITMEKGVFKSENKLLDWVNGIQMDTVNDLPGANHLLG